MIFDLTENIGVWFDFPGGGRVQLKAPTTSDILRIEKETTENKPFLLQEEAKPPRVLNHEIVDVDKRSRLFNDCTILAWEDFFDADKKPIPCTSEMKTVLMRLKDPTFRDFVSEKLKVLGEAEKAKAEEEVKNS
ncbi:MAG: hypothetical protein A4E60_02753 [Syntrophorhabdus sp. PtaB.Bin047]|jgi:hypothetical protein|nr:MAG: hypothetical protein A4E60_02753 [Syntrophorhabdus sp. PtaB.Bin047]